MTDGMPGDRAQGSGPVLLLVLAVLGFVGMAPLMFMLLLSTAQSYAIPGARASALTIALACLAVLVIEVVTIVRRRRAGQGIGIAVGALVVSALTTTVWVLFWLVGLRTL